jgi:hypothetical protein
MPDLAMTDERKITAIADCVKIVYRDLIPRDAGGSGRQLVSAEMLAIAETPSRASRSPPSRVHPGTPVDILAHVPCCESGICYVTSLIYTSNVGQRFETRIKMRVSFA